MSEAQIARAGYMAVQRIRKLAKLNRLVPEVASSAFSRKSVMALKQVCINEN